MRDHAEGDQVALFDLWEQFCLGQEEFSQPIRGAKTGVMDAAEESRHPFTSTPIRMSQPSLAVPLSDCDNQSSKRLFDRGYGTA